ncbi:MAG: hypothetical protein V7K89_11755 [Nostoc sp.]
MPLQQFWLELEHLRLLPNKREKSPGKPRKQRTRFPIVKKTFNKSKKVSQNTA